MENTSFYLQLFLFELSHISHILGHIPHRLDKLLNYIRNTLCISDCTHHYTRSINTVHSVIHVPSDIFFFAVCLFHLVSSTGLIRAALKKNIQKGINDQLTCTRSLPPSPQKSAYRYICFRSFVYFI